jgi:hypothetical protein
VELEAELEVVVGLVPLETHTIYLNNTNKTVKASKDQLVQVEAGVIKKTFNFLFSTRQKQASMVLSKVEAGPVTILVQACSLQLVANLVDLVFQV